MDMRYLITDTRARAYLLWAVLVPIGFVATHFYQQHAINFLWTIIAIIGLGFMYRVMPLRVGQMRKIFLAWLVPIALGISVSGLVFYIHTSWATQLLGHLGAFWLGVMAVGFLVMALVDAPSFWYWFAVVVNVVASVLCFGVPAFTEVQFLVAAIISGWSMLNLWLFRSEAL